MTPAPDLQPGLEAIRTAIVGAFPALAGCEPRLLTAGWHSVAADVDDRLIFKFPRHEAAERALRREARLLARVRPMLTLPVPDLTLHAGPPLFSRHEKLEGEHLLAADYARLPEAARERLAADLARFYAELHGIAVEEMAAAGAEPVAAWGEPADVLERAWPALPTELRAFAERAVAAWSRLPADPCGTIYGFFDGHGWNMAFDHAHLRLNGIYDFADSGLGPLHQEFIYSNFISPDLTVRIVASYQALTGRALDRHRIATLTAAHRVWELAEAVGAPGACPQHVSTAMVLSLAAWAASEGL